MTNRFENGYRGYIWSRPCFDSRVPQHIQNQVIRDFAGARKLLFKLSATEYALPGSFLILNQLLKDLPGLDGVILYSMFMLPADREKRLEVYSRFRECGSVLYAAVEDYRIATADDAQRVEDVWSIHCSLRMTPLASELAPYATTEKLS